MEALRHLFVRSSRRFPTTSRYSTFVRSVEHALSLFRFQAVPRNCRSCRIVVGSRIFWLVGPARKPQIVSCPSPAPWLENGCRDSHLYHLYYIVPYIEHKATWRLTSERLFAFNPPFP